MTTPPPTGSDSGNGPSSESEAPFDPYRFGHPDVPPAPEYAPPGYRPPTPTNESPAQPPAGQASTWGQPYGPPPNGQPPYGQPPYGQPPYGQAPYGQPPYGQAPYGQAPNSHAPYGQPPYDPNPYGVQQQFAPARGNGKATAGLVLGIVSIVLFFLTIFDAIFVIVALVFAILGLNESKVRGSGRGAAIAGIVCAALGAVLAIAFTVFAVHLSNECGGTDHQNSSTYQHCIKEKL